MRSGNPEGTIVPLAESKSTKNGPKSLSTTKAAWRLDIYDTT